MKQFYKFIMSAMIFMYRRANGSFGGRVAGFQVLLLTTTGRKSGLPRTPPLGFFEDNGSYIISASNAGGDTNPAWFANVQANPKVMLEIKRRRRTAIAEIAAPADRVRL
jgi:deazaflavin-dependent oxidoreductase (nitroreductase family)